MGRTFLPTHTNIQSHWKTRCSANRTYKIMKKKRQSAIEPEYSQRCKNIQSLSLNTLEIRTCCACRRRHGKWHPQTDGGVFFFLPLSIFFTPWMPCVIQITCAAVEASIYQSANDRGYLCCTQTIIRCKLLLSRFYSY